VAEESFSEVGPRQLLQWLEEGQSLRLLDVREPDEWEICRLPQAELRPLEEIATWAPTLDPAERLVVYCHHGIRSLYAALYLSGHGFSQVINLRGGLDAYSVEADPQLPRY
jgi:sulfur-carrier protein adenylyltransferase/sulfurtransferase